MKESTGQDDSSFRHAIIRARSNRREPIIVEFLEQQLPGVRQSEIRRILPLINEKIAVQTIDGYFSLLVWAARILGISLSGREAAAYEFVRAWKLPLS